VKIFHAGKTRGGDVLSMQKDAIGKRRDRRPAFRNKAAGGRGGGKQDTTRVREGRFLRGKGDGNQKRN